MQNKNQNAERWDEYFALRGIDASVYRNENLSKYFRAIVPADRNARICDIGCGFGQTLRGLRALGYKNLVGLEPSEAAAAFCKAENLPVQHVDVQGAIESGVGKFDFVFMMHVLEHVKKDEIVPLLRKIRTEMLLPNGRLFIAVPNAQSNTGPYWRYEDWTHETLFTAGSLFYVLKDAGFRSVEIYDGDCMLDARWIWKFPKRMLLAYYRAQYRFWNWVTASSTHKGGTSVFSYEVKAVAQD